MVFLRFLFSYPKSLVHLNGDGHDEEKETLIHAPYQTTGSVRWSRRRKVLVALSFIVLESILLLLVIALLASRGYVRVSPRFEPGWLTEIGPPFPSLSIERVQFTAGLDLDDDGRLIRTGGVKGEPQYVGKPNDEMDANWEFLIPSDTNITRREAQQIGGEFYFYPGTDVATIEISSFHILHCMDQVRQSVHWQHYWPDGVDETQQVHVDHCIDIMRQYIQCHMDLTPIPLVWSESKGGLLPDFKQTHTCRSYEEAHRWVLKRNIANYEHGMGDQGVADDARRTLERFGWG
ncbi:hypothetical protein B0H67DRAFT_588614 [Lasiosphaeris hirsuta]|uniref:Tat pathway signal sequence n=1 Tax=Lasiosphaeris hirsuta TaxID=260670 RepID=A0AA40A1W9_9PEZI|nr:hypothetical protein B0H67DRAFT_588614 [Lasiosphaeris hirsuta]